MTDACTLCGAPLEIEREYTMAAAGFGPAGTESVVSFARVRCAAGHLYDAETGSVDVEP
jgi:hypothetical protein